MYLGPSGHSPTGFIASGGPLAYLCCLQGTQQRTLTAFDASAANPTDPLPMIYYELTGR